jgi:hypothetical protein
VTGLSDEVVLAAFGVGIVALIAWDRWSKARTESQDGGGAQPGAGGAPGTSDGGGGGGDGPGGGGGDGCGGDGGGGTC